MCLNSVSTSLATFGWNLRLLLMHILRQLLNTEWNRTLMNRRLPIHDYVKSLRKFKPTVQTLVTLNDLWHIIRWWNSHSPSPSTIYIQYVTMSHSLAIFSQGRTLWVLNIHIKTGQSVSQLYAICSMNWVILTQFFAMIFFVF